MSVQRFPTAEEATRDFGKVGEPAAQSALPADRFAVEVSVYQAVMDPGEEATTRIAVFAVDGNVLVTGRFEVVGAEGRASGMPVEVMNEVMAAIAP